MRKNFKDIFWDISEPEYRKDPALSQSTISSYERNGRFECLDTLFDRVETPSLTFGSAVDTLITDGDAAFAERFFVCDIPKMKPSAEPVVKKVYEVCCNAYTDINDIPDSVLMPVISQAGYMANTNWGTAAKCKSIKTEGQRYYQTMFMAKGKAILPQDTYNKVFACVRALKDSPQTRAYFKDNGPFESIERFYQLKFRGAIEGVEYRGMADLLIVDHNKKTVVPCDLKTSHNKEYNFPRSFLEFRYDIQARLYWRLIRQTMDNDDFYKDYTLADFRFIVVNNNDNPAPLVWVFQDTSTQGTLKLGNKVLRDPVEIGKELHDYLVRKPVFPKGITLTVPNSIQGWFNEH